MSNDNAQTDADQKPAVGAPVERGVRPRAWLTSEPDGNDGDGSYGGMREGVELGAERPDYGTEPLYDQAALEAARDEGYAIGREAEAEYWRSMVERMTAQADAWNARYMELVQQVADGRAMRTAPAIVVDLGPSVGIEPSRSGRLE